MAGSYRHIVNHDGSFRGIELIDNLGDALEALQDCYEIIQRLTDILRDVIVARINYLDPLQFYEAHEEIAKKAKDLLAKLEDK